MSELSYLVIPAHKEELRKRIRNIYGSEHTETLTKENFLKETWRVMSSFVHHNKRNLLIQYAAREYPNFTCRAYVILSIRFGKFGYEPTMRSVLDDFVDMLDKDFDEVELGACTYAERKYALSFFPELYALREMINVVYGAKYFDLSVLPPTPHHAFVLIANNCPELLLNKTSPEALYGHMQVLARKIDELHSLVSSNTK